MVIFVSSICLICMFFWNEGGNRIIHRKHREQKAPDCPEL